MEYVPYLVLALMVLSFHAGWQIGRLPARRHQPYEWVRPVDLIEREYPDEW